MSAADAMYLPPSVAASGAGAAPFVCVPETAEEPPRGALKAVIDYMVQHSLEQNRMEKAYTAHMKVCGKTVTKDALQEYVTTHMKIHSELETTSGKRYGALEPAAITTGWLGRHNWVKRAIETLPTEGKIWYIHYGTFLPPSGPHNGAWGSLPPDTTVAWAIDNYGNVGHLYENYPCSTWNQLKTMARGDSPHAWTPGDSTHLYPLTKKQIDVVKTLPTEGPSWEHMQGLLPTLLKGWAEETFNLRIAERRRYDELLEEQLCDCHSTSPPTEDLLGITDRDAPAPVKSTGFFDIVKNPAPSDT
jgi:hypothetical protein